MDKIHHSYFIINRFDTYFSATNEKGQYFLAVNTAILGFVFSLIAWTQIPLTIYAYILVFLFSTIGFASNVFILLALNPFLKSGNKTGSYSSFIFFGSIALMDQRDFEETFPAQKETDINRDLTRQIYSLSKGLSYKYSYLKIGGVLLLINTLLLLPLLTIIYSIK